LEFSERDTHYFRAAGSRQASAPEQLNQGLEPIIDGRLEIDGVDPSVWVGT
jgi:hypothetical protein